MLDMPQAEPVAVRDRSRRKWLNRIAVSAFALAAVGVGLPALLTASTSEPAALASVLPADGATVTGAPQAVALIFTGDFTPDEVHVSVASAAGATLTDGDPVVDGDAVRVPVLSAGTGAYLIVYHVLLDDGRSLSGVSRYTVDPSAAAGQQSVPQPAAQADDAHSHVPPADPFNIALTCVATVLIVAMAVLLLRRPRIVEPPGRD
jgi:methionine-rich copper-binding protein CopC